MQKKQSHMNKEAWSTKAYEVWTRLYGEPKALAQEMKENTDYFLRRVLIHTGEVKGKRIINLCGSNGRRAVPLALKGADVTVVDISAENMKYAIEVSKEAGVSIRYDVADVMQLPSEIKLDQFDFVLMEFGILHYFADLNELFKVVANLLNTGGRFILTDFHPFLKAMDGDYFDESFNEGQIAYYNYVPEHERSELKPVLIRRWRIGEIITSIARNGLVIREMMEEPNKENNQIPSNYTLISDKISVR